MSEFGRRISAKATRGIGNWGSTMSFVSYIAIPINVLVLIVCRFPNETVGAFQDSDNLTYDEESVIIQWLWKRNKPFWNRANMILLAVAFEHLIISLKIVIALLIPDVPASVIQAEQRRAYVTQQAQQEMLKLKRKTGAIDFEDIRDGIEEQ